MGKQVLRNENLFFILSDILFAEQVSIERNNPVIVIFRHLLPLLPNLYFFMSCSGCFFFMSCSGLSRTSPSWIPRSSPYTLSVIAGLDPAIQEFPSQAGHP